MSLQGMLETHAPIFFARVHFGQKDGVDFAQISLPDLGDMNNEVKSVMIQDNTVSIVFDVNGFDMHIYAEKISDVWTGKMDLDAADFHANLTWEYVSDTPNFGEHHYTLPEANVNRLKENHEYDFLPCNSIFKYELNNPEVLDYVRKKGIDVENNYDFDTVCKLMEKTCALIHHDGVNYCHDRAHRGTIAQIEFAEKQNGYTNCRGMAIILHGVLRAYGFQANLVECWPAPSDNSDIHVVCEVYLEDLHKTVMLDPSNNLIYFKDGVPLNLFELRTAIANGEADTLTMNENASHNGEAFDIMQMLAYMSKNLVFLNRGIETNETLELHENNSICLSPQTLMNQEYPKAARYTSNVQQFYT